MKNPVNRRRFLAVSTSAVLTMPILARGAGDDKIDPDEGVTAPEDLMKEHGVLNRCLLIYEEGMRRLQAREDVSPEVFNHTAHLIRTFVEEYHEKNEEKYIFPEFERADKLTDLVEHAQNAARRRTDSHGPDHRAYPSQINFGSKTTRACYGWPAQGSSACIGLMKRAKTRSCSPPSEPS